MYSIEDMFEQVRTIMQNKYSRSIYHQPIKIIKHDKYKQVAHKNKSNLNNTCIGPIQLVCRTSSLLKPVQHKPKQANPPHDTTYLKSTPLLTTRLIHRMIRPSCEKLKACII